MAFNFFGALPQRRATDPLKFISEYDAQLFDLASLILLRVNAGRANTHEDYYCALQALTPEHVAAAERFAAELRALPERVEGEIVRTVEWRRFCASLDALIKEGELGGDE